MIRRLDRRVVFGLIVLAAIVLLTLFIAPRSSRQSSGSTFSRAPDGYGAWYAYMERQGTQVQRWRQPSGDISNSGGTGKTFLQINPLFDSTLSKYDLAWVRKGNTWVILGSTMPVTEADFSTMHSTEQGTVQIETTRRRKLEGDEQAVLSDRYGAIVWEERQGKGQIIHAVTPFLAANAYQDVSGNFAFLAKLVTQNGKTIWVDEYLHGHKEQAVAKREKASNWGAYLLKTPFALGLMQVTLLGLILVWAKNRRFGQPMPLATQKQDSSEAYIQALAGVLHKAGRSEFVLDVVGREAQLQIQRSLGLGNTLLARETVIQAWTEQTGRSAEELAQILPTAPKRLSEKDLLIWVTQVQKVHHDLSK
jgi:hypothetical protein